MSVKGSNSNVSSTANGVNHLRERRAKATEGKTELREPDAPTQVPKQRFSRRPHWLAVGILAPALMACSVGAHAQQGAPLDTLNPPAVVQTVNAAPNVFTTNQARETDFAAEVARLDSRLRDGRITPREYAIAKDKLFRALVTKDPNVVLPLTPRGRIDLDALTSLDLRPGQESMTRGERAFDQAGIRLERALRVSARDMAYSNGTIPQPDITASEVQDILLDALKKVPLKELGGGDGLANFIESLPFGAGINARDKSFEELEVAFSDRGKDWFDTNVRPQFEGKEALVGIAAFGAITAVRAASQDAAELMDRLGVEIEIYDERHFNGIVRTQAELSYREARVLPDLDLRASALYSVNPSFTLMGDIQTTLATETDDWFTGTATAGARWAGELTTIDLTGMHRLDRDEWAASLRTTYFDPKTSWHTSGALSVHGGNESTVPALGRYRFELDATREWNTRRFDGYFQFHGGVDLESGEKNIGVAAGFKF